MPRLPSPSSGRRLPRGARALLSMAALLMAVAGAWQLPARATPGVADTVPALDLSRYSGTWYELAHGGGNPDQRGCVADVVTTLRAAPGQRLDMTQHCRRLDGSPSRRSGLALPQGPARFEVSWLPAGLRWLPLGRQDHWVVAVDPGYRVAVVSDRQGRLLRVLAREPRVEPQAFRALMGHLRDKGFEVRHLVPTLQVGTVPQPGGRPAQWAGSQAPRQGA